MKPKPLMPREARTVMQRSAEKAELLAQMIAPILNAPALTRDDAAEWANACALNAGAIMGQLHKSLGVAPSFDRRVAKALAMYVEKGFKIGRDM
jgi:hypothetical protein